MDNRRSSADLSSAGGERPISASARRSARDQHDDDPELPQWQRKRSFRGQPYRYAYHQNGVMGHFQIRIVAAAEISEPDWSLLNLQGAAGRACPYVTVSLGKSTERSSAQEADMDNTGCLRASWAKELLSVEALKGDIPAGEHVTLAVQVYNQDNVVQSVLSSAVSTVMRSQGGLLGAGMLEVSSLLSGGLHLIDTWVELEPRGRVHLHVEYEPKGIEPGPNDVVYLESFARWDNSLVMPQGAPMVVLYRRQPFLLVAFDAFTEREGRVRLHRNCVFVVEKLSWLDVALATAARPVDALLRTDSGSWLVRKSRPLIHPVLVMAAPMLASLQVTLTALKVAFRGMLMGVQAVYQDSLRQ